MTDEQKGETKQVSFFDDAPLQDTALEVARLLSGSKAAQWGSGELRTDHGNAYVPSRAGQSNKHMLIEAAKGRWSWVDRITLPQEVDNDYVTSALVRNIENKRISRRATESYGIKMETGDHFVGEFAYELLDAEDRDVQAMAGTLTNYYGKLVDLAMLEKVLVTFDALARPVIDAAIASNSKTAPIRAALEAAALLKTLVEDERNGGNDGTRTEPGEGDPGEGQGQGEESEGQGEPGEGEGDKDGEQGEGEASDGDSDAPANGPKGSDIEAFIDKDRIDHIMDTVEYYGQKYEDDKNTIVMPTLDQVSFRWMVPVQVPNTPDMKVRVALNLDGRTPDYGRSKRHGTPTRKVFRMRFGDTKVFRSSMPNEASVTFLVDNSSSTGEPNSGTGGAIWKYVGALSTAFPKAEIFMYSGSDNNVTMAKVEPGYRPATKAVTEKKRGIIHKDDGVYMAGIGGTPDHAALLWIEDYLKNVGNTILVHVCDGGPNDPVLTKLVAESLYQKGMRYATIVVGGYGYGSGPYPSDATAKVSSYMRDNDWAKISSIIDYVMER